MSDKKKISDLTFDDKNFNKHSKPGTKLLKKSLEKFGAGRSILLDKNNRIIAGNGVVATAGEIGMEDVQIIETDGKRIIAVKRMDIDLDSEEGRELALADNQVAAKNIVLDAEMILGQLGHAICEEWMIKPASVVDAQDDNFSGSAPKIPITVLGDYYEIGHHRLICGSTTQVDVLKMLFKDQLADLVVTDPPYNVNYIGKTKDKLTIENDKMTDNNFYQFLYDFYTALGSYTKNGGAWYVWHGDLEGTNFRLAMQNAGIMVKQLLIWVKSSIVMGRQDYQSKHEPCLYGWKEGAAHAWYSDRKQSTILEFERPSQSKDHPTMKPVELIAYQIGNSSKAGDIVADGFGGSGTTMVAAHQLDRKAYLCEIDPKYCDVIVSRMIQLSQGTESGPSIIITRNGKPLSQTEMDKYVANTNG